MGQAKRNCETCLVLEYISHTNSNKTLHFTANVRRQVYHTTSFNYLFDDII